MSHTLLAADSSEVLSAVFYHISIYKSERLNIPCEKEMGTLEGRVRKEKMRVLIYEEEPIMWQETPYTIPLVLVSVLFIALGIYVWIHYRSTLGNVGSITVLASTDWILAYALKMASSDLPAKIFWKKMQYPGVVILPVAWLIFAVYYTGRERWVTRRYINAALAAGQAGTATRAAVTR